MKQYIKMVLVLTIIATVCGFLLAAVKSFTGARIEQQILINVKGPALKQVLESSTNDLIADKQEITIDDQKYTVFIGKKDGKSWAIAFESKGVGFGGDIGVMVGYDLEKNTLTGIDILTHQETPGLGSKVSESSFKDNFKGRSISGIFQVKKDGGEIDAVSGATNSSRGVCSAVTKSVAIYPALKEKAATKK